MVVRAGCNYRIGIELTALAGKGFKASLKETHLLGFIDYPESMGLFTGDVCYLDGL